MTRTVGFTGTRRGMNDAQCSALRVILTAWAPLTFIHGMARGADTQAHAVAYALVTAGMPITIHGYPAMSHELNEIEFAYVRFPDDPLARNQEIVAVSAAVLAVPEAPASPVLRSGTWATIRYAARIGRPLYVLAPDGRILSRSDLPARLLP